MNGAMPMPPHVRQNLQGWYDEGLMNLVRFKVGDGGALNLANNSIRLGDARAVTLIDVIVFRGPSEANNYALWAHEMKHVQQYAQWGVHSFAVQYMRSWNSVENPAYEVENRFAQAWRQRSAYAAVASPPQGPQPSMVSPGLPPSSVMQAPGAQQQRISNVCVVGPHPQQRCALGTFLPIMTVCSCGSMYGTAY
ncbi:hypothetical protein A1D31_11775 [Bradyrhizobium liaoningense]|nr:hypothetical protein A1D31_11775 [Bradyrhizobium liaoningense]